MMKPEGYTARINANGRIVIPAAIRRGMGLEAGDTVVMTLEGEVLRIESQRTKIRKIQEEFQKFARPGSPASHDLMTERRAEVRREVEDWIG